MRTHKEKAIDMENANRRILQNLCMNAPKMLVLNPSSKAKTRWSYVNGLVIFINKI
jgi:hypothetical protein